MTEEERLKKMEKEEKKITYLSYIALITALFSIIIAFQVVEMEKESGKLIDDLNNQRNMSSTAGQYFPEREMIIIYTDTQFPLELQSTANHEIAHVVWYQYLSEEEKQEYEEIVKNSKMFVNDYSKKNLEEDFAVHVSYWTMNRMIDKQRQEFFEHNLKRYLKVVR